MENDAEKSQTHASHRKKNMPIKKGKGKRVRKSKYLKRVKKKYTQEALKHAIKAVEEGASNRVAAAEYGIPLETLCRKTRTEDPSTAKPGPSTVLTPEEEQKIVDVILYRARRGYPMTKDELLDSVSIYLSFLKKPNPFTGGRPGRKWYSSFRKRHPQISIRTAQNFSSKRAAVTFEYLRDWFAEVGHYLDKKNLKIISGKRAWNCDESSVQLNPPPEKVLAGKGDSVVRNVFVGNEKECLTVLCMFNAEGERGPPMVVYSYKNGIPKDIAEKLPANFSAGESETGWMTAELFYEYIVNIFYPWLDAQGYEFPIVLYLDGHSSHVTVPLVEFCEKVGIELIRLYPNSTHILQPLDTSYFHPLKQAWKKTVANYKRKGKKARVTKETSPMVLKTAMDSVSDEQSIIKNGFRGCGLMPFDFTQVDVSDCRKRRKRKSPEAQPDDQSPSPQDTAANSSTENSDSHVETFEKNISQDLLYQFNLAAPRGHWMGDVEHKSLFEYWYKLKNPSLGSGSNNDVVAPVQEPVSTSERIEDQRSTYADSNSTLNVFPSECGPIEETLVALPAPAPIAIELHDQTSRADDSNVEALESGIASSSSIENGLHDHQNHADDADIFCADSFSDHQVLAVAAQTSHVAAEILDHQDDFVVMDLSTTKNAPMDHTDLTPLTVPLPSTDGIHIITGTQLSSDGSLPSQSTDNVSLLNIQDILEPPAQSPSILAEKISFEANTNTLSESQNDCSTSFANIQEEDIENNDPSSSKGNQPNPLNESFKQAFTFPIEYLPKKRRASLELKNEPKKVCVGFGQKWLADALEKEGLKKMKDEKTQERKRLQKKKKEILAEAQELEIEAKNLNDQRKETDDPVSKVRLQLQRAEILARMKEIQTKAKEVQDEIKKL